uniref:Thioredoxin domain-containing protein n=1 Tax=Helicotheca tamesis TaxID=374047 RepID=A0A7S2HG68_9STRA|mmetsp:Transcript_17818/g.24551  ORF Transcript_17818/g.24551 Transcript_17818/m.24551 type:complete len:106 (+) Transcript_17818:169-486(+)|eukprot:CAMPEP_0185728996 /NCGR_PEP_ID=MMETSP1171-20130828/4412_1 /TAXON_ID=374046 /ORGANISM="Helicotheca tamensis, Strain CCMP826" /LENGTH=105 /DNA_ID=CAMNT_0028397759 /DNA_START=141 /DNA_END=458 /DNA_ORIENTATION=+
MTWVELKSPNDLMDFINDNPVCLVTFSATWCGPCKASKPKLKTVSESSSVPFGYVYESDLDDFLDTMILVKAFPTSVMYKDGEEVDRVQGVDFEGLEKMLADQSA